VTNPPARRPTAAALRREVKRRNKQAAAARRRPAQRRRQLRIIGLSGLAVVVVIGLAWWLFAGRGSNKPAATSASASASAAACPTSAASPAPTLPFPGVPAGADPALKTKPVVTKGEGDLTELKVKTLIEGKGPATKTCQSLVVNYVGVNYKTGEEFDSSWKNSQTFTVTIGAGQVIKGWDQGLVGVKVGSRVQLDIPPDLAYGEGTEPTKGPLRFVVDVLSAS
jgi:FKBP-type peptidyl-prolyl cis-trans isomerase